jgi:hypothetical protein
MEDPAYIEYFSTIMSKMKMDKNITTNPSPSKITLKTEGYDPENKGKVRCDSFSKILYAGRPKQDTQTSKINLNKSITSKN